MPESLRIICVGDSITVGVNSTDGAGYRSFLASKLADLGHPGELVLGGGNGLMVDTVRPHVDQALATGPFTIALFFLGTNDFKWAPMEGWPARYRALIGHVLDANPDCRAAIATVPLQPGWDAQWFRNLNVWIRTHVAAPYGERAKVCDLASLPTRHTDPQHPLLLTDNVHPGDAGYALIADLWLHTIRPWL